MRILAARSSAIGRVMDEHALIAQYFSLLTQGEPGAQYLANDAASLDVPYGKKLVVTSDSAIEGWHVPKKASAAQLAQKLIRRNLSDLAAMGAMPWRYSLNLNVPEYYGESYIAAFAKELAALQQKFALTLIGGDTTFQGTHAYASVTMLGLATQTHNRSGTQAGDVLYVAGNIGDAALGLMLIEQKIILPEMYHAALQAAYYQPEPQLALGQALHNIAHSVVDVSDGLMQDMAHIAKASNVQFLLDEAAVPFSKAAQYALAHDPALRDVLCRAGDDYVLLFTAPQSAQHSIQMLVDTTGVAIQKIGVAKNA